MNLIPDLNRESLRVSSVPHLVLFFCILLVITGAMYIYSIQTPVPQVENESTVTKEKTIVSVNDVSNLSGKEKLPVGFPDSIPVELDTINESTKMEFPERGVTQYTVVYSSSASSADIQKQYEAFFENESYVKNPSPKQVKNLIQLEATKDTDDLSVIIEPLATSTSKVYVVFLDRG